MEVQEMLAKMVVKCSNPKCQERGDEEKCHCSNHTEQPYGRDRLDCAKSPPTAKKKCDDSRVLSRLMMTVIIMASPPALMTRLDTGAPIIREEISDSGRTYSHVPGRGNNTFVGEHWILSNRQAIYIYIYI
jgi:hypothetical protein